MYIHKMEVYLNYVYIGNLTTSSRCVKKDYLLHNLRF